MSVIDEIAAERRRQFEVEGWSAEHDDAHRDGSLAAAACCYAVPTMKHERRYEPGDRRVPKKFVEVPHLWPWSWHTSWWKPKSRRRDLIRAAALIVAEIERLDRASPQRTEEG